MTTAVEVDDLLGHRVALTIARFGDAGAFLAVDDAHTEPGAPTLLLPSSEVPREAKVGDALDVFVHLDSDERPIATTRTSKLELGEVAFLSVTDVTEIGAFVDWGLGKELFVPFAQQAHRLVVGERHPFGLYLDRSRRLAGTMFVSELLEHRPRKCTLDEWVIGEAWRNDPDIGLFVIVERSFVGLVPASEPHDLRRGDEAKFRVANILADGKIVLSRRQHAHLEAEADAARILEVLGRPDAPRVGDRSSPDELRALFGLSKKAFKRAVGRLLKERAVVIDDDGLVALATIR